MWNDSDRVMNIRCISYTWQVTIQMSNETGNTMRITLGLQVWCLVGIYHYESSKVKRKTLFVPPHLHGHVQGGV